MVDQQVNKDCLIKLKEVARRTGITPNAIRTRLSRGTELPFTVRKGFDGELVALESEVDAYVRKCCKGGFSK